MAGFHIPGDPYYPNQGNGGWIKEDPKEDPEEIPRKIQKRIPKRRKRKKKRKQMMRALTQNLRSTILPRKHQIPMELSGPGAPLGYGSETMEQGTRTMSTLRHGTRIL